MSLTVATIRAGLERLATKHGVKLSDHMVFRYRVQFEDLTTAEWDSAINRAFLAPEFPEPSKFWKFVPHPAWSRGRPDVERQHAKEGMALIRAITEGTLTIHERLARLQDLATRYPGVGWEKALADTRARLPRVEREPGEDDGDDRSPADAYMPPERAL